MQKNIVKSGKWKSVTVIFQPYAGEKNIEISSYGKVCKRPSPTSTIAQKGRIYARKIN